MANPYDAIVGLTRLDHASMDRFALSGYPPDNFTQGAVASTPCEICSALPPSVALENRLTVAAAAADDVSLRAASFPDVGSVKDLLLATHLNVNTFVLDPLRTHTVVKYRRGDGVASSHLYWLNYATALVSMSPFPEMTRFLHNANCTKYLVHARKPPATAPALPPDAEAAASLGCYVHHLLTIQQNSGLRATDVVEGVFNALYDRLGAKFASSTLGPAHEAFFETLLAEITANRVGKTWFCTRWLCNLLNQAIVWEVCADEGTALVLYTVLDYVLRNEPRSLTEAFDMVVLAAILLGESTGDVPVQVREAGLRLTVHQNALATGDATINGTEKRRLFLSGVCGYTDNVCVATNVIADNEDPPPAVRAPWNDHPREDPSVRFRPACKFPGIYSNGVYMDFHAWTAPPRTPRNASAPLSANPPERILDLFPATVASPKLFFTCRDDVPDAYGRGYLMPLYFPDSHGLKRLWRALDLPHDAHPHFTLSRVVRHHMYEPELFEEGRRGLAVNHRNGEYLGLIREALSLYSSAVGEPPLRMLHLMKTATLLPVAFGGDSYPEFLLGTAFNLGHVIAQFFAAEYPISGLTDRHLYAFTEQSFAVFYVWFLYVLFPIFVKIDDATVSYPLLTGVFRGTYAYNRPVLEDHPDNAYAPIDCVVDSVVFNTNAIAFFCRALAIDELTLKVINAMLLPGLAMELPYILRGVQREGDTLALHGFEVIDNAFCLENKILQRNDHDAFYVGPVTSTLSQSPLTLMAVHERDPEGSCHLPREYAEYLEWMPSVTYDMNELTPIRTWDTVGDMPEFSYGSCRYLSRNDVVNDLFGLSDVWTDDLVVNEYSRDVWTDNRIDRRLLSLVYDVAADKVHLHSDSETLVYADARDSDSYGEDPPGESYDDDDDLLPEDRDVESIERYASDWDQSDASNETRSPSEPYDSSSDSASRTSPYPSPPPSPQPPPSPSPSQPPSPSPQPSPSSQPFRSRPVPSSFADALRLIYLEDDDVYDDVVYDDDVGGASSPGPRIEPRSVDVPVGRLAVENARRAIPQFDKRYVVSHVVSQRMAADLAAHGWEIITGMRGVLNAVRTLAESLGVKRTLVEVMDLVGDNPGLLTFTQNTFARPGAGTVDDLALLKPTNLAVIAANRLPINLTIVFYSELFAPPHMKQQVIASGFAGPTGYLVAYNLSWSALRDKNT